MSAALGLAVFSMLAAGINDVVFKRFSVVPRSRGYYICGIGIVWSALQFTWLTLRGELGAVDANAIVWGLVTGILVGSANLLLVEALTRMPVGLGATIYRLNTIPVVIFAVAVLGERLTLPIVAGVAAGVAAILLLHAEANARDLQRVAISALALAVLAALLRAAFALVSKAVVASGTPASRLLLMVGIAWVPVGLVYAWWRERRLPLTRNTVYYSVFSGFNIALVATTLLLALELAEASVVVPIANLSFAVSVLISVLLGMERLSRRKIAALALAAASLWLLGSA